MIWHDEANKILDMKERKDQVDYFRSLPQKIQKYVGPLVALQKRAAEDGRIFGWRAAHEYRNPGCEISTFDCNHVSGGGVHRAKRLPDASLPPNGGDIVHMGSYRGSRRSDSGRNKLRGIGGDHKAGGRG